MVFDTELAECEDAEDLDAVLDVMNSHNPFRLKVLRV